MFNRVVVLDEELAQRLPAEEFELSFDGEGGIYVNTVPLGVNVKERYAAVQAG